MKSWTNLEKDLVEWFNQISKLNNLEFRDSNQAIIGFPKNGFKSDGLLIIQNKLIVMEVEAGQTHPDTNTGKYWFHYERFKKYERIFLFHIYTAMFKRYKSRKELAEFYIDKMKKNVPIEYHLLDYRKNNDYFSVLNNTKNHIEKTIGKMVKTLPKSNS
jgi:hypothetical protein